MRCRRCGGPRPDPAVPCPRCQAPGSASFLVRYPDGFIRVEDGTPWQGTDLDGWPVLEAPHPWSSVIRPMADYDLLEEIGRGSAGVVYRAWALRLERVCAVKMLGGGSLASPTEMRRFQNEAVLAARLDHPAIVRIFDAGEHLGQAYLVMEYLDGESFSSLLGRRDQESLRQGVRILAETARAIDYAHRNGIVHRDLKPDNILLDREGHPHIADFGLATSTESRRDVTLAGHPVGTPWYMAPEQARGDRGAMGPPADVWSLGATLYHLLSGRPPYSGENVLAVLMDIVRKEPSDPDQSAIRILGRPIPSDLKAICQRAMEKDPARRYPSALALAEDLERWLAGEAVSVRPWSFWERWHRRIERRREEWTWAVVGVSGVLLALSGFGILLWTTMSGHQEEISRLRRMALVQQTETLEQAIQAAMTQDHPVVAREVVDRLRRSSGLSRLEVLRPDGAPSILQRGETSRPTGALLSPPGIPPEAWQRAARQRQVVVTEQFLQEEPRLMVLRPILNDPDCRICHGVEPEGQVLAVLVTERSLQGIERRLGDTRKALVTLAGLLAAAALTIFFTVIRLVGLEERRERQ